MVDARLLSGKVLVAVIETGSFVRAAEALGLSDSGVSRAVARLGMRLLERTTRSLRLTDEGGRFYAEAAPLLAQLSDAALAITSSRRAVRGSSGLRWIPSSRGWCCLVQYPDLSLELVTTEAPGDLVAHGFDV
jgi:DNA-binding transcriptional LysR family regulator